MKRLLDICLALTALPFVLPVVALAALAVRLDSPGPAIFVQERLGRGKRPFRCYKLRTMRLGTVNAASHLVGDREVTRVGRLLRSAKIDELPQVLNVLRGEMSFVGPRPGLPVQHELTAARERHGIFAALPGITGLAQVNGIDMSDPERLAAVDRHYVETRSLGLDLRLLLRTLAGGGQGDAARRLS